MKIPKCSLVLLAASLVGSVAAAEGSILKTDYDQFSYAIGILNGRHMMKSQGELPDFPELAARINTIISGTKWTEEQLLEDLKVFNDSITPAPIMAGIKAGSSGGKAEMNDEQLREIFQAFRRAMAAKREYRSMLSEAERQSVIRTERAERERRNEEWRKEQFDKAEEAGEAFLAENKKRPGIVTTSSGLQYRVLTTFAIGRTPTTNDTVIVHYRGTLIDGTEFDNSFKRGAPGEFPIKNVIDGWIEALLIMPVGSKFQLFIPPGLANTRASRRDLVFAMGRFNPRTGRYEDTGILTPAERPGDKGLLPKWDVPPKSALIFEIELLGIKK